ncbi:hypothetical protein BDY19DRAFT_991457 [Irpex rosettiformis]|uniref:Uncharacterized protein n=1 Tax=Irpex rosettiformis TaxID=378272 RepID=A0ACB8UBS8_9APHY|nr:hypothetical protein BDY19DRAFT_991457 [Irpex rosettiformis]
MSFSQAPSPISIRQTHSSGSTPSVQANAVSSPVTVQALLHRHEGSHNPPMAALDDAVQERNMLSSQNAQLWKLIEKQRTGYAQLMKEIERVRGERDVYRNRLQVMGENTEVLLKAHRDSRREGKEGSLRSAASSSHLKNSESTSSNGQVSGVADPRANMHRSQSDDIPPAPHRSQSQDAAWPNRSTRDRQGSQASLQAPVATALLSQNYLSGPQAPPSVQVAISPSEAGTAPATSSSSRLPSSSADPRRPSALSIAPVRSASLPASSDSPVNSASLAGTPVPNTTSANTSSSRRPFTQEPTTATLVEPPSTAILLTPATPAAATIPNGVSNSSTAFSGTQQSLAPQVIVQSASLPSSSSEASYTKPVSQSTSSNDLTPPLSLHSLSRDSRISLPEETKRYYATLADSPIPSPQVSHGFVPFRGESPEKLPLATPQRRSESPLKQVEIAANSSDASEQLPADRRAVNPDTSEFLDLDADDTDTSLYDSVDDSGRASAVDSIDRPDDTNGPVGDTEGANDSRRDNNTKKRAAAEDFPLPPGTPPIAHPSNESVFAAHQAEMAPIQAQSSHPQHASRVYTPPEAAATTSQVSDTRSMSSGYHDSSDGTTLASQSQSSILPSHKPAQDEPPAMTTTTISASFRSLPLLPTDLPYTTIQVAQSTIRPNDRGKDVLSFIIAVNPGHGKSSWSVEKLYSDVLTLDARVRANIGKTVGKKLVTLPEGKLWRDHAPAKVDQRKCIRGDTALICSERHVRQLLRPHVQINTKAVVPATSSTLPVHLTPPFNFGFELAALESYLRSLIALPVKNKDEIIAFLTSGIASDAQKPVARAGYKEGYLTKRGKNFGGWKTRYFVLQGPSLEYYESRGGAHLGSITITGAQIGRQQRTSDKKDSDEDNEYRHAFLIIEAKKGPGGANARHVLCAESDQERDHWVELLVRYVTGKYNDADEVSAAGIPSEEKSRVSVSSSSDAASTPPRRLFKDDIAIGGAAPISHLAQDPSNAKLFQAPEDGASSPARSQPSSYPESLVSAETPTVSSLPTTSPLVGDADSDVLVGQRANSELGHYPDLVDQRAVFKSKATSPDQKRKENRRSVVPLKTGSIPERSSSPEKDLTPNTPRADQNGRVKISAPIGGTPLPAGFKFGKDTPPEQTLASDRREKAKSRMFWGFGGRHNHESKPSAPVHVPRAVFAVSLEESLAVAEIAGLPAIVFRSIQYLEAKKADQEEGIYRLSGSSAVIKALKDRFNNEGDVDLLGSDELWDLHAISGLLKTFLRDLPTSILTRDLHLRFLSVIDFADPQERIRELSQLIAALPVTNYSLLRALTAHLILIVQNANVNKMTMRNVGIVFSPTLGIPAGVFSLMLSEFKRVFNVDGVLEDEQPPAPDGAAPESVPMDRRNSKRYSDAAADELLGLSGRTLSTAPNDDQSDEGEGFSVQDESGTDGADNTENESITESSGGQGSISKNHLHVSDDTSSHRSHASSVAASRGLNIATDKASRRHSRMVGLPHSPRPQHSSPHSPHTPQKSSAAQSPTVIPSPLHTPR